MNPGLVLAMLAAVTAALVLAVAAAAFVSVRRPWRLRCPRDGREAQVQVDRAAAVRAEVLGGRGAVARCSLWPEPACGEACLATPATARRMATPGEPLPTRPGRAMILVPLDGTPAGEAVLPTARALAREHDARLRLLRVVPPVEALHDAGGRVLVWVDQEAASAEAAARDYLRKVAEQLDGFVVDTIVRFGDPAGEILRAAEAPDVVLIAMAPRHRGWWRRSLTARVARRAWVPVFRAGHGVAA
jgi:nucleotide-binding universal stress UspA family protein